jgi:hypothetical protein
MYNSQFICTYSFYDTALRNKYHSQDKFDLEDVEEFADFSDLIYQADLLKAFCYSSAEVETGKIEFTLKMDLLMELYDKIIIDPGFLHCVELAKTKHVCEDNKMGFTVMFSYDYFFLTHKCVSEFLNSGEISIKTINDLKTALE